MEVGRPRFGARNPRGGSPRNLHLLARPHLPRDLVLEKPGDRGDDQSQLRRRNHRRLYPEARLPRASRVEFPGRCPGIGRDGSGCPERLRRRLHDRRPARAAACRQTGTGHHRPQDRRGNLLFSYRDAHRIQFNSWDHFQVPLPLTRAIVLQAPPIWVPADANEAEVREYHQQMQQILDGLRDRGDRWERTGNLDS